MINGNQIKRYKNHTCKRKGSLDRLSLSLWIWERKGFGDHFQDFCFSDSNYAFYFTTLPNFLTISRLGTKLFLLEKSSYCLIMTFYKQYAVAQKTQSHAYNIIIVNLRVIPCGSTKTTKKYWITTNEFLDLVTTKI